MINLFVGWDEREKIGSAVFAHSVRARESTTCCIFYVDDEDGPSGSNRFTYARFRVPQDMDYQGHAIFMDGADMLMLGDLAELDALFDPRYAVQVVKHANYKTRHKIKYVGTDMECPNTNYARKNWASVMLINCEHEVWRDVPTGLDALQLKFIPDELIGELPDKWNRLVDEGQPVEGAAVLHFTAGIPEFAHYANAPGAELWHAERKALNP